MMEYIIIVAVGAVVGCYLYKQRISSEPDTDADTDMDTDMDKDKDREIYVCDQCGEKFCDCHKKKRSDI